MTRSNLRDDETRRKPRATREAGAGLCGRGDVDDRRGKLNEALRHPATTPRADRRRVRPTQQPGCGVAADDRRVLLRDQLDCQCSRVLDGGNVGAARYQLEDGPQATRIVQGARVSSLSRLTSLAPSFDPTPDTPVRRSMIMTNRTTKHLGQRSGPARGNTPGLRLGAGRPRAMKFSAAILPQGVWDRDLDGAAPRVAPIHHLGIQLLDIVAHSGSRCSSLRVLPPDCAYTSH